MTVAHAVFDPMGLQAATLDVVAATHATPRLIAQRQQQRVLRLLEAARTRPCTASAWASSARAPPICRGCRR
jgi:hypothetical protein